MKITGVGILAWPKVNEDEYHMFVDPTEDETRLYNCGGLPVGADAAGRGPTPSQIFGGLDVGVWKHISI